MSVVLGTRRVAQVFGEHLAVHAQTRERCTQLVRGRRGELRALAREPFGVPDQRHDAQAATVAAPAPAKKSCRKLIQLWRARVCAASISLAELTTRYQPMFPAVRQPRMSRPWHWA